MNIDKLSNVGADRRGVERFTEAMHAKMTTKRAEGRGGWHREGKGESNPETWGCSTRGLQQALRNHIARGLTGSNLVDIANFCMMVWNREHPKGRAPADTTAHQEKT